MSEIGEDIPCGRCEAGVYDAVPVLAGLRMFGECASQKRALASAPRCESDQSHICFGARDWIVCQTFPMTEADKNSIREACAA